MSPSYHQNSSPADLASHPSDSALQELLDAYPHYTRNFIEYIVDRVIEAVRIGLEPEARGRSSSRQRGPQSIAQFVLRVLHMSDARVPVLLVALVYIERCKEFLRISQEQWAHERVFLGALICAHKYVNDVTIKNKHWSICSGLFSARDISRIEREFLQVMDYELGFTESDMLVHYSPLMALLSHQRASPIHMHSPIYGHSIFSTSYDHDNSDSDSDSDSSSSADSSSPPTTPLDSDTDASSSYVHIPSHPHSPVVLPCLPSVAVQPLNVSADSRPTKTPHTRMSAALRLLHAFPTIHHVPAHRAQPVTPKAAALVHPQSCEASPLLSPPLKSHHDILVTSRFEKAFC